MKNYDKPALTSFNVTAKESVASSVGDAFNEQMNLDPEFITSYDMSSSEFTAA